MIENEAVEAVGPLDEWNAMKETLHVLGSADNTRRLMESIAQADAG
jgi:antitoxin YefM